MSFDEFTPSDADVAKLRRPHVNDEYLGDGVYASWDGYHVVLDLRAQGPDRIALEPPVLEALDRYRAKVAYALAGNPDRRGT